MMIAIALPGIPLVRPGDSLLELITLGMQRIKLELCDSDIIVVAQKIVSKSEGRLIDLATITPSKTAINLGHQTDKDPRLVQLILAECVGIVLARPGMLLVEHKLGFVLPNAGIDQSNIGPPGHDMALLLPEDPDLSAVILRGEIRERFGVRPAVLINDSVSRPWRNGTCGLAIGVSGLPVVNDLRGQTDMFGRELQFSISGFADEVAATASLVMGQRNEGTPIVVIRGLEWEDVKANGEQLLRRPSVVSPELLVRVQ